MADEEWFYVYGGKHQGPVNGATLLAKIARGELGRDIPVWRKGMEAWQPAASVQELGGQIPPSVPASQREPKWYRATLSSPNKPATIALWLALISIFCYSIGIIPLVALGTSIYGLVTARQMNGVGRNRALIALVVSILYTLMYLGHYGHLGK